MAQSSAATSASGNTRNFFRELFEQESLLRDATKLIKDLAEAFTDTAAEDADAVRGDALVAEVARAAANDARRLGDSARTLAGRALEEYGRYRGSRQVGDDFQQAVAAALAAAVARSRPVVILQERARANVADARRNAEATRNALNQARSQLQSLGETFRNDDRRVGRVASDYQLYLGVLSGTRITDAHLRTMSPVMGEAVAIQARDAINANCDAEEAARQAEQHAQAAAGLLQEMENDTALAGVVAKERQVARLVADVATARDAAQPHIATVNAARVSLEQMLQAPAPQTAPVAPVIAPPRPTAFQQFYHDWYDTSSSGFWVPGKCVPWFLTIALVIPAIALAAWGAWDYFYNRETS